MNNKIISYISLFLLVMQNVLTETYAFSRYVTVVEKPHSSQINLLTQTIHMRIIHDVRTIRDAINYLLRFSSCGLAISLMQNNKMILFCGYGWADLEKHQAMNMVHYPFSRIIDTVVS